MGSPKYRVEKPHVKPTSDFREHYYGRFLPLISELNTKKVTILASNINGSISGFKREKIEEKNGEEPI